MELTQQGQMVLGALLQEGGPLLPSDFVAKYDFREPCFLEGVSSPRTQAVVNFDIGIREVEYHGLVESYRDAVCAKRYRLTEAGHEYVALAVG